MAALPAIIPERCLSRPDRLAGRIPRFVDVVCMVPIDGETGRYYCWGYYESTSETWLAWLKRYPRICDAMIVAQARAIVHGTDENAYMDARSRAEVQLSEKVWKSQHTGMIEWRNKLAEDLKYWEVAQRGAPTLAKNVEVVDARELNILVGQTG